MTTELLWRFSSILIRILLDSLIIQQIQEELDDHRIIVKIFIDFDQNSVKQLYHPTIQEELDDHRFLLKIVLNLIRILQEIDEHRIVVKISLISIRILLTSLSIKQFRWSLNSSRVTGISIRVLEFLWNSTTIWIIITFKNDMTIEL